MLTFARVITALMCLVLSSCATVTTLSPPQNAAITWQDRAQTLSHIKKWTIIGHIAIRTHTDAGSASLQWQQNNKNYTIQLLGPLGPGATLFGTANQVKLITAQGKTYTAINPELLLTKHFGWKLPISQLFYWIRGLPAPHTTQQARFDSYNHLIELSQQGWHIQYLRYNAINNIDLPSKIIFSHPKLNVKIIINSWEFSRY